MLVDLCYTLAPPHFRLCINYTYFVVYFNRSLYHVAYFLMNGALFYMIKNTLYFLCTGNSCRSQMAEGFAKKYLPEWNIKSAGIEAHGLNPNAVKAMAEKGIDISQQTSDIIDQNILEKNGDFANVSFDAFKSVFDRLKEVLNS